MESKLESKKPSIQNEEEKLGIAFLQQAFLNSI